MLTTQERLKCNQEHARWRVEFLLRMLDAHRQLPKQHDSAWRREESVYLRRLAAAQAELDGIERRVNEPKDVLM